MRYLIFLPIVLFSIWSCGTTQKFEFPKLIPETSAVVKNKKFLSNKFIYYYDGSISRDFTSIPQMFKDANWPWVKQVKVIDDSTFSLRIRFYQFHKYDLAALINYYIFADIYTARVQPKITKQKTIVISGADGNDSLKTVYKVLSKGEYLVNCEVEEGAQETYTTYRNDDGTLRTEMKEFPVKIYTLYYYDEIGNKVVIRQDVSFK